MKALRWIFLLATMVLMAHAPQVDRTITGTVTDASDGSILPGVNVAVKGMTSGTVTDGKGWYQITVPPGKTTLVFSFIGYITQEVKLSEKTVVDVSLIVDTQSLSEVVVTGYAAGVSRKSVRGERSKRDSAPAEPSVGFHYHQPQDAYPQPVNTEEYEGVEENIFHSALKKPLSTFSIDVDAASYSNVRRFINNGQMPPADAVRIEEMINYFDYDYAQPKGEHPFNIITEISSAPWNKKHKLIHVGLQGKKVPVENLPPTNLVFLVDVSGSMSDQNKLPLLKTAFKLLVDQLRPQDQVSMVVYAGAAGLVLEPTSGDKKEEILDALDRLQAGGSTAGGAGINLAYQVAKRNFKKDGNNRVVLATDGDFNVGESSNESMEQLIEEKRKDGIFLTVLGFGMGNYKDSKMEILADKGNGNYAYIDNLTEARKVLVNEFGGTLFTIAKDVKLQVEFNPAKVKAYRLIGYENRLLKDEDFNNDKKDAGELGSGHSVTALYEIIPAGVESEFYNVDKLKYQEEKVPASASASSEIMTVKFRYKAPDSDTSKLIVHPLIDSNKALAETSDNFRWSAAVAAFGMMLRDSQYVQGFNNSQVVQLAQEAKGHDAEGYRIEFINLVKSYGVMARK